MPVAKITALVTVGPAARTTQSLSSFAFAKHPRGQNFDSILVGYYDGHELKYAASIRAGITPASRQALFKGFSELEAAECPFSNLPDKSNGRWGAGIAAEKMAQCQWLKPKIIVAIDFLEWTFDDRLRHASFAGPRTGKPATSVHREG